MADVVYSKLYALALLEPWRLGQGRPNALDPTWQGYNPPLCEGNILWEPGTGFWLCEECGYIGRQSHTHHYPAMKPWMLLVEGIGMFITKRVEQGLGLGTMLNQLMFVAGLTARYAATHPPEQLGAYASNLITK
jgi:hypothetical protein